jgi:hypothetical protein
MAVVQQLAELREQREEMQRASDFISIAKILLESEGRFVAARQITEGTPRVSQRVRLILSSAEAREIFQRAAVPPLTLTDSAPLAEYKLALAGFAGSLSSSGTFDRLLAAGFRRIPLALLTVGAVNTAVIAAVVSEASVKPVSAFSLSAATTTVRKSTGLIVVTKELARATDDVSTLLGQELRKAVIAAIDNRFISIATSGAPSFAASGTNVAAFFADVGVMANALTVDANARLFLIMGARNALQLSLMLAQSASPSTLSPRGGSVAGIEVVVSDAVQPTQMVLLDASAFAAAAGDLALTPIAHSTFQLDTSPDSPVVTSTNVISLWQQNLLGLIAERFFICERLRTGAAAVVNGASYASGFSP